MSGERTNVEDEATSASRLLATYTSNIKTIFIATGTEATGKAPLAPSR
jgi:hypothetical protein